MPTMRGPARRPGCGGAPVARSVCWRIFRARRSGSAGLPTARRSCVVARQFAITVEDIEGTVERCSTTYKGLPGDVRTGDLILIDDGRIALRATEVTDTDVITEVTVGGPVSNNKGINLPARCQRRP